MSQINKFRNQFDFLSNFYPIEIFYNGIEYPSVEHAYQAQKTLNDVIRLRISTLVTASEAKKESYKLTKRGDWDKIKVSIMKDLLFLKFNNPDLKDKLLSTGNSILIEGNDWGDSFWGICNNTGLNMLGILLMYVRHCIKYKDE